MTRVSTYGSAQILIGYMLQQQQQLVGTQQQVSSGYKSQTYKGIAQDTVALESAKALRDRTDAYVKSNTLIENRVQTYDTALRQIGDIADELRQDVLNAVATNSGTALAGKVQDLYQRAVDVLNKQVDGRYIFAGSRTDTPPVSVTSAAGLLAASPVSSVFANDQNKATAQLDDNLTVTYGVTASDAATNLFSEMQRILQFDSGTLPSGAGASAPAGSFGGTLAPNQKDFLSGEIPALKTMVDGVQDVVAANGIVAQSLADVQDRQNQTLVTAKSFIGDIQDADTAQAITNLNQDQTALQASYEVLSKISSLNLLDFLK